MELTKRSQQICEYIARFTTQHGFAPTIREIGNGVGIASTSAVLYQIQKLERAGVLSHKMGFARTIVLSPELRWDKPNRRPRANLSKRGTPSALAPTGGAPHAE